MEFEWVNDSGSNRSGAGSIDGEQHWSLPGSIYRPEWMCSNLTGVEYHSDGIEQPVGVPESEYGSV